MASYAQIAQKTFSFDREDGTTRQWQFTFDKKNGTAQAFDIPIIEDVEVIQGNRSDAPNKPFKTHKANFTLNGVSESLITEITGAGLRDIRVTIVDTATSRTVFEGFVLPEFKKYSLYTDVQQVKVRCYGALADLDKISILPSQTITLDAFASDIATALDLDRELDVYSKLHHDGALSSDPLPLDISFSEDDATGNDDEATLLDSLKSVMTALGWQAFQRNGRLIFADLYDRFNTPTAVNKHESDGLGGYTNTTENVEVSLDQTNILVDGEKQDLTPVIALQQRHNLVNRDAAVFTDPSPHNQVKDTEGEHEMTLGLALEGDVITASLSGELITQPQATGSSGTNKFARIELRDFITGDTFYFDPSAGGSWTLTETFLTDSFSFDPDSAVPDPFSFSDTLPPVPKEVLADLVIVTTCDPVMNTGSRVQLLRNEFDSISISISYADPEAQITHVYESSSGGASGDILNGNTFAGDNDTHTVAQAFQYGGTGTSLWNSPTGNGTLGSVVAERVGAVAVGKGVEFTVVIRDTTDIDLLSVVKIEDNDATILTCLPVEIRHRIKAGYYRVLLRQAFNGVTTTSDTYVSGMTTQAGTSTGGGVTGGVGGGTGGLTVTQGDARYFRQINNLSEGTPATMLTNLGLTATAAELNRLDGTLAVVQSNLGLKDGTAILGLSSLTVGNKTITVNKGGTNTTAESAGLIIERPAGNQSVLWNSTDGFDFSDIITATGATITGDVSIGTTTSTLVKFDKGTGLSADGIKWEKADQTFHWILVQRGVADNNIQLIYNDGINGSTYLTVDRSGNVGIGTTSPADKLEVEGGFLRIDGAGSVDPLIKFKDGASVKWTIGNDDAGHPSGPDAFVFAANDGIGTNEYLVISNAGNVGIGTASPGAKLDVNGTAQFQNTITQTAGTIGTDNFVSQLTGWRGTYAGDWDVRTIFADEARFKAFTADITQALAGSDFLTKSVAILDTDFTVPWGQPIVAVDTTNKVFEVAGDHTANVAVSNTLFVRESTGNDATYTVAAVTFNGTSGNTEITVNEVIASATADGYIGKQDTISVEDLPGQDDIQVFTDSDWIKLPIWDRSGGGLTIGDAWGLVTGYTDQADGTQDWTFTTLDSGFVAGLDIFKGSIILDFGQSGDGFIERTVLDTQGSPYSQVVTWTTDPSNSTNHTIQTRLGILDGITWNSVGLTGAGLFARDRIYFDLGDTDPMVLGKDAGGSGKHGFKIDANNFRYGTGEWKVGDGTHFLEKDAAGNLDMFLNSFKLSATNILIDSAADRAKFGDATTYIDWNAGTLDIVPDSFNLDVTTLVLDSATPKLALGAAAASLGLSSVSDTGTYLNGSGHVRIGTTDASGNLDKGFKFDGTNALLEAGNASIGVGSGFFGASDILAYSLNSVTLAAFTANNEYLTNGQTYIGENLSQFNIAASGNLLLGDFGTAGTNPRVQLVGLDGARKFLIATTVAQAQDDLGNAIFQIDLDGTNDTFIGGTFFDENDLWLSPDGTKANATVLLSGANSAIVTDSIGELIISPSSTADFTTNADAGVITDDEFHERITRATSGGPSTSRSVKKRSTFKKRFGADKIIVTGIARQAGSAGEGGAEIITRNARIYAKVTDQVTSATAENFQEITSTSNQQFSFELDISTMTNNNLVLCEISVYVDISITSSSGDTEDTECWLREDVTARTAT